MLLEKQVVDFHAKGYIVLPGLFKSEEMDVLKSTANDIVKNFDPESTRAIFSTTDQTKTRDEYFLSSGDKVRCFFEEHAFDDSGNLAQSKALSINKIGHALHNLVPEFAEFSQNSKIKLIAKQLGGAQPQIRQSMYIFKQPKIGGEIRWHQDATYFYTRPISVITFWFAVEDANLNNGCLQVQDGGSPIPLKEQFLRYPDDTTELKILHDKPWPNDACAKALEVKKGSLVVFKGELPHFSAPNLSEQSRHAYTLHVTCGLTHYVKENWLQAQPTSLL